MSAVELEKLCPGCMSQMPEGEDVCPKCGWRRGKMNAHGQLPAGTILGGKYFVGAALHEDQGGVTYMAYDIAAGQRLEVTEYFPKATASRAKDGYTVTTGTGDVSAMAYLKTVPNVQGTVMENGTAYALAPVDLEREKQRVDTWKELQKKEREEEAERVREKKERERFDNRFATLLIDKLLCVLALIGCFFSARELVRLDYALELSHYFKTYFLAGYEDMAAGYPPIHGLLTAAVFAVAFALLGWLAVSAVMGLFGKPRKKIWWALGACALAGACWAALYFGQRAKGAPDFYYYYQDYGWFAALPVTAVLALLVSMRGKIWPALVIGVAASGAVLAVGMTNARDLPIDPVAPGESYAGQEELLTREVYWFWNGGFQYTVHQYDSQGTEVQWLEYDGEEPEKPTVWTFERNEQGDVVLEGEQPYYRDSPLYTSYDYEYDDQGRMIEKTEGGGSSRETYIYDENGELAEMEKYGSDGELQHQYRYEYLYDDEGRMTESRRYADGDDTSYMARLYEYTADGCTERYEVGSNVYLYEYDSQGRLIREQETMGSGEIRYWTEYIYETP